MLSGSHYIKSDRSISQIIGSAIYSRTIGLWWGVKQQEVEDDDEELVSVEYLKRKAESILNWAVSVNKEIISEY